MYQDRNDRGNNNGAQRQMFTGNWTCGTCGAAITELPFEPDPSRLGTLKCRDCHRKSRQDRGDFRGGNGGGGYRRF